MVDDPLNRLKVKRGSDLPHAKLNEKLILQIREEARWRDEMREKLKQHSNAAIARRYGVHLRTIDRVLTGEGWSHVD